MARAAQDSEHAPWLPSEPYELEQQFDPAPTTAKDLQEVATSRLADIQYAVLHGDFAQGRTVKNRPNEMEVQKWVANELRNRQGRAYSVEREPHVVEEKEPDIRLRTKVSDVSLPIEVKVAKSWTLAQLEEALTKQLLGRFPISVRKTASTASYSSFTSKLDPVVGQPLMVLSFRLSKSLRT